METISDIELLLPPNWRQEVRNGVDVFVNEMSGEETTEHPYHQFLRKFTQTPALSKPSQSKRSSHASSPVRPSSAADEPPLSTSNHGAAIAESIPETTRPNSSVGFKMHIIDSATHQKPSSPNLNEFFGTRTEATFPDLSSLKEVYYDYHCQWTERDLNGDISMYGLTIRYQKNRTTMIKFDGIDATWTYTALKGPYGCLEMHDLFVGAKVTLFGRHLTISAANSAACKWISKEKKRLEKQQEEFRRKVESIGEIPCVKRKDSSNVKDITRVGKLDEQTNLRLLLKENARLGEQLANLGLAQRL